jgi:LDH2 family malate/lactate/ureidoglycolate dehydrogenase
MQEELKRRADHKKLKQFASLALQRVGVSRGDADLSAEILIDTDLRGIDTHGVMNLRKYYVNKVRSGIINAKPTITCRQGSPTTALLDGDNGLGFVVSHKAMQESIKMAKDYGSGWTTVCHSNHGGAGTYYLLMAVREEMIGIHFSSGGTSVAGPGGRGKLIGNNVVALGAPAGKYAPFVFDMAPTMSIANKAHKLAWDQNTMPEGYVIDGEGRPVTDPRGYFDPDSAVLPLGSTLTHGIHKGFGLLLMSDLFTGILSGDGGSMLRKKGVESHFFGALRIDAFTSVDEFKQLMEQMIEKIHRAPLLDGAEKMRYPGEHEYLCLEERKQHGIPLHARIVEDLREMSMELELPFDDLWLD